LRENHKPVWESYQRLDDSAQLWPFLTTILKFNGQWLKPYNLYLSFDYELSEKSSKILGVSFTPLRLNPDHPEARRPMPPLAGRSVHLHVAIPLDQKWTLGTLGLGLPNGDIIIRDDFMKAYDSAFEIL